MSAAENPGGDAAVQLRALRAQSNAAIAARDVDGVVAVMDPEVRVQVAGGPLLAGREASRAAFAEQFADRAFRGYVRTPDEVAVDATGRRATERGRWEGRWRRGIREEVMRGGYVAEWRLAEGGWRIEKENYFALP